MADKRENISSGSIFEASYGYSRAVKVADTLYISGTIGMDYAANHMPESATEQLHQIIKNFQLPLERAGATLKDIVQITTYVTTPEVFAEVGPVMGEIFGAAPPANAALVVNFPVPGVKVEISAVARIGCGG